MEFATTTAAAFPGKSLDNERLTLCDNSAFTVHTDHITASNDFMSNEIFNGPLGVTQESVPPKLGSGS